MTCTIIGLVVACTGAPVNSTPAQSLALMRQQPAISVQIPDRPADAIGPDTPERALAIMKANEPKIILVPILDEEAGVKPDASAIYHPRLKFGESPWWWKLYDPWWYEPWVAKPWQLEPIPEPPPHW